MTESQPPTTQKKKGLGALAWIGIGCGALIVIVLVVVVGGSFFLVSKVKDVAEDFTENPVAMVAENIVRFNPDLELVESDREAGKITVREISSGKEITFDYEDISEGNFAFVGEDGEEIRFDASAAANGEATLTIKTEDGTTSIGAGQAADLPDWLPVWSGSVEEHGGVSAVANDKQSGTFTFTTEDSVEAIVDFYREAIEDLGVEINESTYSGGGTAVTSLTGTSSDYEVTVTVSESQGEPTTVLLIYSGPAD